MPFGIAYDSILGRCPCDCCDSMLHHCEKCWNKHHNGIKHKDYTQPKYYGQSMIPKEIDKIMLEKHGITRHPKIRPDKNRKYNEGEYH